MPRFNPETVTADAVPLRGVEVARMVVLSGGLVILLAVLAGLVGLPPSAAAGRWAVAGSGLGSLTVAFVVLLPSRSCCAVRRAALATLFQLTWWGLGLLLIA